MIPVSLIIPPSPISFEGAAGSSGGDSLYSLLGKLQPALAVQSVTASVATSVDNYAPTGYTASTTNRLLLTPASGGSTLNGLLAAVDGWEILLVNMSATDNIYFTHQSSSTSTNQFSCPGALGVTLGTFSVVLLRYVVNQWFL